MNPNNIAFLESHRHVHREVIHAKTAKRANDVKDDLIRILREEFMPGYVVLDGCTSCLFEVVRILYDRFDKWKAEQAAMNTLEVEIMGKELEGEMIHHVKADFPVNDKPDGEAFKNIVCNQTLPPISMECGPSVNPKHKRRR